MQNSVNATIRQRKKGAVLKLSRLHFFKKLLLIAAVCLVVFTQVFGLTTVHGIDMAPAVKDGDVVVFFRIHNSYANGDVIVFTQKGKKYISRVAATPGDVLQKGTNKQLVINGRLHPKNESEGIFCETMARRALDYPVEVKDGDLFVLGDKRDTAEDSRAFGCIKMKFYFRKRYFF